MEGHTALGSWQSHLIHLPSLHVGEWSSFPGLVPPNDMVNSESVVDIKPGDSGMAVGYQVDEFTHTLSRKHFVAQSHIYPGFTGKVSSLTHFPLEPGCEDWAFYFQGSGLPLFVSGSWSGSMCRAHIALQELWAIAMMLHRMAFCLSGKVVNLHLDNSTAKAYLCNQCGTVSPFLSRLAYHIVSLTNKYGITLIPAYIPTHLNVEANYLSQDQMLPEWCLLPQAAFAFWVFQ